MYFFINSNNIKIYNILNI